MEVSQQQNSATNYRIDELPEEILQLMSLTARLAQQIDETPLSAQMLRRQLKVVYKDTLMILKERAHHHYNKRKLHFRVEHLSLRKLVIACSEIIRTL